MTISNEKTKQEKKYLIKAYKQVMKTKDLIKYQILSVRMQI